MRRFGMAMALLLIAACSTTRDEDRRLDREVTGAVLFETYTVDLTWGYRLSGTYIDGDGGVWSYARSGSPWYPERLKPGELSERDMLTKHAGAQRIGTVDRAQLREIAQLIKPAAAGPIHSAAAIGAGSGTVEVAYLYDPSSSSYREIILAGDGERVASNAAPEARLLLDYLREVQGAVGH